MGVIIDIVPNHMGVAGGGNDWWNDVLAKGQTSRFARFFDIDWSRKLVLPILGDPLNKVLADGQIVVERRDDVPRSSPMANIAADPGRGSGWGREAGPCRFARSPALSPGVVAGF